MSLIKYQDNQSMVRGNGRGPLSFNRAHSDGMPYRGSNAMLREEEYENYTEIVRDGYVELFDLTLDAHKAKVNEIIDAASNGWYSVYKMVEQFCPQPDGSMKVFVYCVWSQPYRELAKHRVPVGLLQQPHKM